MEYDYDGRSLEQVSSDEVLAGPLMWNSPVADADAIYVIIVAIKDCFVAGQSF